MMKITTQFGLFRPHDETNAKYLESKQNVLQHILHTSGADYSQKVTQIIPLAPAWDRNRVS